jgi:PAS domain S-box-containing protein
MMKSQHLNPDSIHLPEGDSLYRNMIQTLEVPLWLCNKDGQVLLMNDHASEYVKNPLDIAIGRHIDELIPMPDKSLSKTILKVNQTNKKEVLEAEICFPSGFRCISWSFTPLFTEQTEETLVQLIARDLTDHKQTEKQLASRLLYELCISKCSQTLMTEPHEIKDVLNQALQHLQEATGICRVYIFENFVKSDNALAARQICEACAPEVPSEIENPLLQCVLYDDGLKRWRDELSKGKAIKGLVKSFPSTEREILEPQGILSILALPIQAGNNWFGFIGFDDTKSNRQWNEEDIRLLNTAAEMIGTFIERRRVYEALELEHLQLISIFDTINEPIYVVDPDSFEILYQNDALTKVVGNCTGQKCHQALQGFDSQCPFCTNQYIFGENLGKSYIWEFQLGINKRWYRCIEKAIQWPDKRMVRCEVAIDIDDIKKNQEKLRASKQKVEKANLALSLMTEDLQERNKKLQEALDNIEQLSGLLPICANCKKVRDDKGYWNQIEVYIESRSSAQFSHGICEECAEVLYRDTKWYQKRKKEGKLKK